MKMDVVCYIFMRPELREWFKDDAELSMPPLDFFNACLKEMLDTTNPYSYRNKAYEALSALYDWYEEIREVYVMPEYVSGMRFVDRVVRRDYVPEPELPVFTDEYDHPTPLDESGLYLIGDVKANPYTGKMLYIIKVGRSKNLEKRINQYYTENPLPWFADFLEADVDNYISMERDCHAMLKRVAYAKADRTDEWFFVDKDTYLEICEKGFHYFFTYKD